MLSFIIISIEELSIPMNKAHGMDTIQRQHHLGCIKASPLLRDVVIAHQVDQVPTGHVFHHHVEVAVILEREEKLKEGQNVSLCERMRIFANERVQTSGVGQSGPTCTTQELLAKAMMSLSSQKKAESDLLIISNLLSNFMAYTLHVALCLTWCRYKG